MLRHDGPDIERVGVREELGQRRPLAGRRVPAGSQTLLVARRPDLLADAHLAAAVQSEVGCRRALLRGLATRLDCLERERLDRDRHVLDGGPEVSLA